MYKRFSLALAILSVAAAGHADYFSQYGDVQQVPGGPSGTAFRITSDSSSATPYGGVYYVPDAGTTLNDITNASADFSWLQGTFGGGAPRFSIGLTNGTESHEAWIYWGTGPSYNDNPGPGWQNTGNLLASSDTRFDTSSFASFGGHYGDTSAHMYSILGSWSVNYVSLDVDGSWSAGGPIQQMDVADYTINRQTMTTPEPASLAALGSGALLLIRRRRARSA